MVPADQEADSDGQDLTSRAQDIYLEPEVRLEEGCFGTALDGIGGE